MRATLEKKVAQREKEKKEENLKKLAQKAREERAGIKNGKTQILQQCHLESRPELVIFFIFHEINYSPKPQSECFQARF